MAVSADEIGPKTAPKADPFLFNIAFLELGSCRPSSVMKLG